MHHITLAFVEQKSQRYACPIISANLLLRPRLIVQVVSNAIARSVMLVKKFYFPIDVVLVLLLVKVAKLDNTCFVGPTRQRKVWWKERATGKHNFGPSNLSVLMPKKKLIQAEDVSS